MKSPEYQGNGWALHNSDCIEGMEAMPENSVDCAIFSPPFGDLFVYSDSERDLGNAGEGDSFLEQYKFFANALTRVIRTGRMICVHCTDLPMRKGKHGAIGLQDFSGDLIKAHTDAGLIYHGRATIWIAKEYLLNMKKQGLVGYIPPDDVLSDLIEHAKFDVFEWQKLASPVWMNIQQGNVLTRIKGPNDERHVCPLQLDTIQNCLRLYTKPGDVVLDPFNGIGSTGYEAIRANRKYMGFELKPEYAAQAGKYLAQADPYRRC